MMEPIGDDHRPGAQRIRWASWAIGALVLLLVVWLLLPLLLFSGPFALLVKVTVLMVLVVARVQRRKDS